MSTTGTQRQIPIMGEARRPALVDDHLIARCENEADAILLCVHLSRFAHEHICESLGVDKGHWSRILQGRAHFPTRKRLALMRLCGNLAPIQYEAMQSGLVVRADPLVEEEEALAQRLEEIRRRKAA